MRCAGWDSRANAAAGPVRAGRVETGLANCERRAGTAVCEAG